MALDALQIIQSDANDRFSVFAEYIASDLRSLPPELASYAKLKLGRAHQDLMEEIAAMVSSRQCILKFRIRSALYICFQRSPAATQLFLVSQPEATATTQTVFLDSQALFTTTPIQSLNMVSTESALDESIENGTS